MFDGTFPSSETCPLTQDLINIRAVRARLLQRGWCFGSPKHGHDCLGSAIISVYGIEYGDQWEQLKNLPIATRVCQAVKEVTGFSTDWIPTFNDRKGTTKKIVYAVLGAVERDLIKDGAQLPMDHYSALPVASIGILSSIRSSVRARMERISLALHG